MRKFLHLKVQCRRKAAHLSSDLQVLHAKVLAQEARGNAFAQVSMLRLAAAHGTESGGHLKVLYGKVLAQDAIGHGAGNALMEVLALHKHLCQPSPARRNPPLTGAHQQTSHKDLCQSSPAHRTLPSQERTNRQATTGRLSYASTVAGRQARGRPFCD